MKVLITGATGFLGKAISFEMGDLGYQVVAAVRDKTDYLPEQTKQVEIGDLSREIDWFSSLKGVSVVVHSAARVHMMNDGANDPLTEFRNVNTAATLCLAKQAAETGVKRFVFISSIKVNGELTDEGQLFTPDDLNVPGDPYGLSKYEAEQGLLEISQETKMEIVIIRLPLVYGPGVRANFASMMKWMNAGIPLPLGAVHNSRSLVALDNAVSFILHCADFKKTPQAANQVFLISDGEDVSTTELLQKVAKALNKKPLLVSVPVKFMMFVARLLGKKNVAGKLFCSLQIDSSKAKQLLTWKPVITMDDQLKKTAEAYLNEEII